MRMYDIILKKRHGEELTDSEIKFFIDGFTSGDIPDYQASALCMAVCFNGMNERETSALTRCMTDSGDKIDLSSLKNTADKHSTGGVGDKTTLIVAPIAAALGLSVAKMSGRGLGHTGGTIDKLESISGYRTSLTEEEFLAQVKRIGIAVIGQTGNLTPADKKLYALRDVTATVDSLPLIVSSIMSKKLAAGAENIVLDVKCGSGAFMKTPTDAEELAREMVKIGKMNDRHVSALTTNMDRPLGHSVGNSLEVLEAVRVLRNEEKGDLRTLCLELASEMYSLTFGKDHNDSLMQATAILESGKAYEKMLEWISAQGGDIKQLENDTIPVAPYTREVKAPCNGYISHVDAEVVGHAACVLGAGRMSKSDTIDLGAGIVLKKNTGEHTDKNEVTAVLYSSSEAKLDEGEKILLSSMKYSDTEPDKLPLIYGIIK